MSRREQTWVPRPTLAWAGWLALCVLLLATEAIAAETVHKQPNILILMADNWSWPHAGVFGDPVVKTPTFDALAREGIVFTRAYCSVPSCSPARAVFLTGRAAHRLEDAASLHSRLPVKFAVFPDLLEAAGYRVGYAGKGWGPGNWQASDRRRNPAGEQFADFDSFLKDNVGNRPFCFWFSSRDPHVPWTEGRDFLPDLESRRERLVVPPHLPDHPTVHDDLLGYYCEVQNFDRECGRLLDLLRERKLLDDTLVLMLGDNGWQMPRGLAHMYDLSTHVPLAIRWSREVQAGQKCEAFVSFEDIAPTLLELAGLKPLPAMTGRSLLPMLQGKSAQGWDAVFLERERHANVRAGDVGYPCRGIRTKDYLYLRNLRPDRWPAGDPVLHFAVGPYGDVDGSLTKSLILANPELPLFREPYRLIFAKRPAEELFDLRKDPGETTNVAEVAEYAQAKRTLREQLDRWMLSTDDPRATTDDDRWDKYPYYGNPAKVTK